MWRERVVGWAPGLIFLCIRHVRRMTMRDAGGEQRCRVVGFSDWGVRLG